MYPAFFYAQERVTTLLHTLFSFVLQSFQGLGYFPWLFSLWWQHTLLTPTEVVVWRLEHLAGITVILNFWDYTLNYVCSQSCHANSWACKRLAEFQSVLNFQDALVPTFGVGMESICLTCMTRFPCHDNCRWWRFGYLPSAKQAVCLDTLLRTLAPPELCRSWCCGYQWQPELYLSAAPKKGKVMDCRFPEVKPILSACILWIPGRESAL